ncbi:MAG: hypothetical protein LBP53_03135 [Candidatus Peribacteria bacterium]|jgi:hypothetical protein|nr:hypothetical protein [Candidatus Peribacteria bacterium]
MKKIQILQKEVQDANAEGFMTGKMFTEGDNNKEYTNNLLGIINHNVEIRTNAKQIRAKILDRINQHTSGENYVELPLDLLKE